MNGHVITIMVLFIYGAQTVIFRKSKGRPRLFQTEMCQSMVDSRAWREFCNNCVAKTRVGLCSKQLSCKVSLPQNADENCKKVRSEDLSRQKMFYKVKKPKQNPADTELSVPVLDQMTNITLGYYKIDKFSAHWFNVYFMTAKKIFKRKMQATKYFGNKDFSKNQDYYEVSEFFKEIIKPKMPQPYFKFPSTDYEYFTDLKKNELFLEDRYFVQMRLAGINPMTIKRATTQDSVGVNWNRLEQNKLNKAFKWDEAVRKITGKSLKDSISANMIYVSQFPLLDGIAIAEDLLLQGDISKGQQLPPKSPIAVFASKETGSGQRELKCVAIQIDSNLESDVYTPADGGYKWHMAKVHVQLADIIVGQLFEHLLRTHIRLEPICIAMHRHLSKFHPLNEILKFHCRGLIAVNKNGIDALLGKNKGIDKLYAGGRTGGIQIVMRGYSSMYWNDIGYKENIKNRGMDDKAMVPFYPYRDDGKLINKVLQRFSRNFVRIFYESNGDVADDSELQNFINEASQHTNGLPSTLNTKSDVRKFLKDTLWIVAQHGFVNFPVAEYGSTASVSPTKLYQDPRAEEKSKFVHMLPGLHGSIEQATLAYSLGSLRYDSLFDYSRDLSCPELKQVVKEAYAELMYDVKPIIDKRNKCRFKKKQLTNPFMVPGWIPNSIST